MIQRIRHNKHSHTQ